MTFHANYEEPSKTAILDYSPCFDPAEGATWNMTWAGISRFRSVSVACTRSRTRASVVLWQFESFFRSASEMKYISPTPYAIAHTTWSCGRQRALKVCDLSMPASTQWVVNLLVPNESWGGRDPVYVLTIDPVKDQSTLSLGAPWGAAPPLQRELAHLY